MSSQDLKYIRNSTKKSTSNLPLASDNGLLSKCRMGDKAVRYEANQLPIQVQEADTLSTKTIGLVS